MAMTPAQWFKTVSLQIFQPAFIDRAKKEYWETAGLYSSKTSHRAMEQTYAFTGFGAAQISDVYGEVAFLDMEELPATQWTHTKYTAGGQLPEELIEDSQYVSFTKEVAASIGEAHAYTRDYTLALPLTGAFATWKTWDGNYLCSAHPISGTPPTGIGASQIPGGTPGYITNTMGALSLNYQNLFDMCNWGSYQAFTWKGLPMHLMPKAVIFHPSKRLQALKAAKNVSGQPDTANRNDNWVSKTFNLKLIDCIFLPYNYWFVVFEGVNEDFVHWRRVDPKVEPGEDFNRYGRKWRTRSRFSAGPRHYIHIVGATAA